MGLFAEAYLVALESNLGPRQQTGFSEEAVGGKAARWQQTLTSFAQLQMATAFSDRRVRAFDW